MSVDPIRVTPDDNEPAQRSSVQIDQTAKQVPMLRVKVYSGETDAEMQRIMDLALRTYEVGLRKLQHIQSVAG